MRRVREAYLLVYSNFKQDNTNARNFQLFARNKRFS